MDARKRITQVVSLALGVQLILMLVIENVWLILLPTLLASVPTAILTMRSPETVRLMTSKLGRAYFGALVLSGVVIALFILLGDDIRLDLQFLRVLFADLAILWLSSIMAVHIVVLRRTDER